MAVTVTWVHHPARVALGIHAPLSAIPGASAVLGEDAPLFVVARSGARPPELCTQLSPATKASSAPRREVG